MLFMFATRTTHSQYYLALRFGVSRAGLAMPGWARHARLKRIKTLEKRAIVDPNVSRDKNIIDLRVPCTHLRDISAKLSDQ